MGALTPPAPTRGHGLLEARLAKWRRDAALKALKPAPHGGALLDIGCGSHPFFLLESPFDRKVGMDQAPPPVAPPGVELLRLHLQGTVSLPFPDDAFDCVSSLAFIEHLDPESLPSLLSEMRRVLRPAGQIVITTPHAVADGVLRVMARAGLVSREEIDEHKSLFLRRSVFRLLRAAGFAADRIAVRGFQLGLNILALAEK